jgi:hypothetical protein
VGPYPEAVAPESCDNNQVLEYELIALFGKMAWAAMRRLGGGDVPDPTPQGHEKPAQHVVQAELTWRAIPGTRNRYETTLLGERWELHVDDSDQGTRYILLRDGKYVREEAIRPQRWAVRG